MAPADSSFKSYISMPSALRPDDTEADFLVQKLEPAGRLCNESMPRPCGNCTDPIKGGLSFFVSDQYRWSLGMRIHQEETSLYMRSCLRIDVDMTLP